MRENDFNEKENEQNYIEVDYDDYTKYDNVNLNEGRNDSIASIAIPILILVLAPGFVMLQTSFKMDLAGAILSSMVFLFLSFICFNFSFVL